MLQHDDTFLCGWRFHAPGRLPEWKRSHIVKRKITRAMSQCQQNTAAFTMTQPWKRDEFENACRVSERRVLR
jgi:hypothetical protein